MLGLDLCPLNFTIQCHSDQIATTYYSFNRMRYLKNYAMGILILTLSLFSVLFYILFSFFSPSTYRYHIQLIMQQVDQNFNSPQIHINMRGIYLGAPSN